MYTNSLLTDKAVQTREKTKSQLRASWGLLMTTANYTYLSLGPLHVEKISLSRMYPDDAVLTSLEDSVMMTSAQKLLMVNEMVLP